MHFVRRNSVLFYDRGIVCYRSTPIPHHIKPKPSLTSKNTPIYNDSPVNYEQSSDDVGDFVEHHIDFVPNKPLNLLDSIFEFKKPEDKPKEKKTNTVEYCGPSIFWDEVTKNWPKYDPNKEQDIEKSKPKYSYNVLKGKGIFSDEKPIKHNAGYMPPILRDMHENSYIYKNAVKTSEQRNAEHVINRSYRDRRSIISEIYDMELKQQLALSGIPNESSTTDVIDSNTVKSTIPEEEFSPTSTPRRTESSDSIILSNRDGPSSEVASIYTRITPSFLQNRLITDEEIYKAVDSPFTIRSIKSFKMDLSRLCSTLSSKNTSRALSRYTTSVETAKSILEKPILSIDETPEESESGAQLFSESFKRNSYIQSKSPSGNYELDEPQDSGKFEGTSDLLTEYKIGYPENETSLYNEEKSSSIGDYHLNELYNSRNVLSTKSSCSDLYVSNIIKTPSEISLNLSENQGSDTSKNDIEVDLSKEFIDVLQKGDSTVSLGHMFTSKSEFDDTVTKIRSFEKKDSTISLIHMFTNKSDFQDQLSKQGSFNKYDSTISLGHMFTTKSEFENTVSKIGPYEKADSNISLKHMFTTKSEFEDIESTTIPYEKADSTISLGHMFTNKSELADNEGIAVPYEKADSNISIKHMLTGKTDFEDNENQSVPYEKEDSTVSLGHMLTNQSEFKKADSTISLNHMFTDRFDTQDEFITESRYIETEANDADQGQLEYENDTFDFRRNVVRPLKNNRYEILVNGFDATAYIVNTDKPSTSSHCKIFFDYDDDKLLFKLDQNIFDIFATDLYCEIIRNKRKKHTYLKVIMEDRIDAVIAIYCEKTEYIELLGGTIGWLNEGPKINENDENSRKAKPRKSLFDRLRNKENKDLEDTKEKRKSGKSKNQKPK
eukprot:XP_764929.1 hypothetical protein [Theileria parva strain Muguga]